MKNETKRQILPSHGGCYHQRFNGFLPRSGSQLTTWKVWYNTKTAVATPSFVLALQGLVDSKVDSHKGLLRSVPPPRPRSVPLATTAVPPVRKSQSTWGLWDSFCSGKRRFGTYSSKKRILWFSRIRNTSFSNLTGFVLIAGPKIKEM